MSSLLFVMILALSACVSKPVAYQATKVTGRWETKALVRNLKDNKSNSVSIDFVSVKPTQLRAEVSGPMGVSLATLVLNKDQAYFASHTQKKFYHGIITERSLVPIFKITLDPRILINVLFDDPLPPSLWDCHYGADRLLDSCQSKSSNLSVVWSDRNGESKRIAIRGADFDVQIFVKDFSTIVQADPGIFVLQAPSSYANYQLN